MLCAVFKSNWLGLFGLWPSLSSFFSSHLEDGRCHLEFIGDLWLKMQLKNRDANYSQYPCPPPTIWTLKRMCVGIQILRSTFLCMCEYFWSSIGIRKCFCLCCRGTWYLGLHCHISYLSPWSGQPTVPRAKHPLALLLLFCIEKLTVWCQRAPWSHKTPLPICVLHRMVMVLISGLSEVWVPPPNGRQCMGASIPGAQVQCTMEDYNRFLAWKRWCCLFLGCFLPLFLWLRLQICTNTSPPVWASAATQNSKMCFWVMGRTSQVYNQQHDDSKEEEEWCKLIVLDSDGGKWWRGNGTDCKWGHEIFLVYLATQKRRI